MGGRGRKAGRRWGSALALCAALVALGAIPGSAAAKDQNRPLILVHGHEADSGVNCRSTWLDLMAHYRVYGYKGSFHPVQYYRGDTGCNQYYGPGGAPEIMNATSDTRIQDIAKNLAWYIYNTHNKRGTGVNIVAHSMGGLIVRYMIDAVQRRRSGFPPVIVAPSVVTLGTPHDGIDLGPFFAGCRITGDSDQCRQMDSSSSFIEYLRANARNPQGGYGTWWSLGGSHADNTVDEGSATNMSVKYKIRWDSNTNLEHSDYMHEKLGANPWHSSAISADCSSTTTGSNFIKRKCFWPIQWSYTLIAYYGY